MSAKLSTPSRATADDYAADAAAVVAPL